MAEKPRPEDIAAWQDIAKRYYQTQQKLVKERAYLQDLMASSAKALEAARGQQHPGVTFLKAQRRVAELTLKQMEVFSLDETTYTHSPGSQTPTYELHGLEILHAMLLMERAALGELDRLLAEDLPRVRAEEAAIEGTPAYWLAERRLLEHDVPRLEQWEKFRVAMAAFEDAMKELDEMIVLVPRDGSDVEKLDFFKELRLPTIKGVLYRAHGVLRMMPAGEAVAKGAREHMLAALAALKPIPAARQKPSGLRATTNRLIETVKPPASATDRLRNVFKPPTK